MIKITKNNIVFNSVHNYDQKDTLANSSYTIARPVYYNKTSIDNAKSKEILFLCNCIDINWNEAQIEGLSINTSGDFFGVINTILAFIDIVTSVSPTYRAYVGTTSELAALGIIESTETDPLTGWPIYHINHENATDENVLSNLVKISGDSFDTTEYLAKANKSNEIVCNNGETVCYFLPLKFVEKENTTRVKSPFSGKEFGKKIIMYSCKNHHNHLTPRPDSSSEYDYVVINGEKYVVAMDNSMNAATYTIDTQMY